MAPLLSVCVPTFNREQQLSRLFPVIEHQVQVANGLAELVVLDNCSDVPVTSYLTSNCTRFVRNGCNIGPGGNIMRAIELAAGQFVWLLGDDDLVLPNAVNVALEHCQKYTSASHVFFSHPDAPNLATLTCTGPEEFCSQFTPSRYGGVLWMSAQMINRGSALQVMRYAYAYHGSSPQLAFALLNAERTIVFSKEQIVEHTQANSETHWNVDSIYAQMSNLLMLPITPLIRRALAAALANFIMTFEDHFTDVLRSFYIGAHDAHARAHILLTRFRSIATATGNEDLLLQTLQCERIFKDSAQREQWYKRYKFDQMTTPRFISKQRTNYIH